MRGDAGFTLTELMVTLSLSAVVMLLVTAAVLQAGATSARVDAAGSSQSQAHQAFDRLDRQVRWAAGFSAPATLGSASYVEWLDTASGPDPVCHQLRLAAGTRLLQTRSWTQDDLSTATPWQVLASGVATPSASVAPFTLLPADAAHPLARLHVVVTASAGGPKTTDRATTDVTFTAMNSAGGQVQPSVCAEGRPVA